MKLLVCLWLFLLAAAASGQAVVEHSLITAAAAAAGANAKGMGNSISGVLRGVNGTLDKATTPGKSESKPTASINPPQSTQSAKPLPVSKPVDPSQITEGLERAELIDRFVPPLLIWSAVIDSQFVETLWYNTTT